MATLWRKVEEQQGSSKRRTVRGFWPAMAPALIGCLVCATLLLQPLHAFAQSDDDAEYRLKLAYLYNFAQFVKWPPEAFRGSAAPLTVCVAGPNPFQGELEQGLRGRTVDGHPIEIKRLKANDDPGDCHMMFVRASEKKQAPRLFAAVKGSSTLTVGETKGFADMGGVINLTLEGNKLRFEINLDAAQQTRLKISSKLLALGKIVKVEQ